MELVSGLLSELKEHKDALQAIYFIAVALFGVIGIYYVNQRNKALQKTSNASDKQARIAELSQVNDQYIKSIEQLGNDNSAIQLGGVYGLEQVAHHESGSFYRQVIEVLTAYIRKHAVEPEDEENYSPDLVIQAILTVLGRANNGGRVPFDLSHCCLRRYRITGDFAEANFSEANFTGAICRKTNFTRTNCFYTDFTEALCDEADFTGAFCVHAGFTHANCREADFTDANCHGADFTGAFCDDAIFIGVDLTDVIGLDAADS